MPNHVTTRCVATGPETDVAAFLAAHVVTGEDGRRTLDFNTVIPMPALIAGAEESSDAERGAHLLMLRAMRGDAGAGRLDAARLARIRTDLGMSGERLTAVAAAYLSARPDAASAGAAFLRAAAAASPGADPALTPEGAEAAGMILVRGGRRYDYGDPSRTETAERQARERLGMHSEPLWEVADAALSASPGALGKGRTRLLAFAETGFGGWYEWSIRTWGTKWNCYSFDMASEAPGRAEMTFDTAWSFPEPILEALAAAFPAVRFECDCYDEGGGFAGTGAFNPRDGDEPFGICEATPEIHETVYGHPPETDDGDE